MSAEPSYRPDRSARRTAAESAAIIAGVFLLMSSAMDVLQGISALAKDELYAVANGYVYAFDLTTWGWIHLILGVIGVLVAIGILMQQSWAYAVGLLIAGLAVLTNFAFLPYYPLWSLVVIGFDVFVIWALIQLLRTDAR